MHSDSDNYPQSEDALPNYATLIRGLHDKRKIILQILSQ